MSVSDGLIGECLVPVCEVMRGLPHLHLLMVSRLVTTWFESALLIWLVRHFKMLPTDCVSEIKSMF